MGRGYQHGGSGKAIGKVAEAVYGEPSVKKEVTLIATWKRQE